MRNILRLVRLLTIFSLCASPLFGPSASAAELATSYQNFKTQDHQPLNLGNSFYYCFCTYVDIDGDGRNEVFTTQLRYDPSKPQSQAQPSAFAFHRVSGNRIGKPLGLIRGGSLQGCIHPRKPLAGDFNSDGRQDIFVACHGWDAPPFPGETNKIVLSQPDGSYIVKTVGKIGFYHGAAAADVNRDGKLDVIVGNNKSKTPVQLWLGNGKGGFRTSTKSMPRNIKSFASIFTVEVPDVNHDGKFDLVLGGHGWQNAPLRLYLNPGSNNFSRVKPIIIPDPKGYEIVVDVAAGIENGNSVLWILRTRGSSEEGALYVGYAVQKFDLSDKTSKIVAARKSGPWAPWIFVQSKGRDIRLSGFSTDRLPAFRPK